MTIRHAKYSDLDSLSEIEAASYPAAEGASRESISDRLLTFPSHFWLMCEGEKILGFINGMTTDLPDLIQASIPSLWVLCGSYLFTIPAFICFQAVSGSGKTKAAFFLESASLVIYTLYCLVAVQILRCDVAIAWLSEAVYAIAILSFSALYLRRHFKRSVLNN